MCSFCNGPCGQREFCDEACYHEYMQARMEQEDEQREDLPGESRYCSFDEPPEWDVVGGL